MAIWGYIKLYVNLYYVLNWTRYKRSIGIFICVVHKAEIEGRDWLSVSSRSNGRWKIYSAHLNHWDIVTQWYSQGDDLLCNPPGRSLSLRCGLSLGYEVARVGATWMRKIQPLDTFERNQAAGQTLSCRWLHICSCCCCCCCCCYRLSLEPQLPMQSTGV